MRDEPLPATAGAAHGVVSILFPDGAPDLDGLAEPPFFRDLTLDQVVEAVVAGREEYDLREALTEFGERMHRVRSFRALSRKQHKPEKQRWLLDAAALYVDAVAALARRLGARELDSQGLAAFSAYLAEHVAGESFTALAREAAAGVEGLAGVAYALRINGTRVSVSRYGGEPDESDEVDAGAPAAEAVRER